MRPARRDEASLEKLFHADTIAAGAAARAPSKAMARRIAGQGLQVPGAAPLPALPTSGTPLPQLPPRPSAAAAAPAVPAQGAEARAFAAKHGTCL